MPGPPSRESIRRALQRREPINFPQIPGRRNDRPAAVLVPLIWVPVAPDIPSEPVALSILRSHKLRQHGGEVAFPGGKPEPGDGGLLQTALREAREELGIEDAEVLGALGSVPTYTSDYRVSPFVAAISPGPLVPDPGEVARVLRAPLRGFLEMPQIDALSFEIDGQSMLSPVFDWSGHAMYGGTAHAFLELLALTAPLFGLPLPPLRTGRYTWESLQRARYAGV